MNLFFDTELGKQQNKATHKIRVMSEAWLEKNGYCPCCGSKPMQRFTNYFYTRILNNEKNCLIILCITKNK